MKGWKFCAEFQRPKDMKGNSKRPKGMDMAVFWMSSECTGIWFKPLRGRLWKRWCSQQGGGNNPVYEALDTCLEWCER